MNASIGITASSLTTHGKPHYSLSSLSPSYKTGIVSNAGYTQDTQDLAKRIQVSTNNPTPGVYGWTL